MYNYCFASENADLIHIVKVDAAGEPIAETTVPMSSMEHDKYFDEFSSPNNLLVIYSNPDNKELVNDVTKIMALEPYIIKNQSKFCDELHNMNSEDWVEFFKRNEIREVMPTTEMRYVYH